MSKKRLMVSQSESKISDSVQDFLSEKETLGRSAKTLICYKESLEKFIMFIGPDMPWNALKEPTVLDFQKQLRSKKLSFYSVNSYLRVVRAFIYWGYDNGLLKKRVPVKMVKGQEAIKEPYGNEDLEKLLARPSGKATFTEWRNWAIINWILGTGNRIGTVVNLQLKDIDLIQGMYQISAQKNKKVSAAPIDTVLISVLKEYIKKCRKGCTNNDFLFPTIYGEQMTVDALKHAIIYYNHSRGVRKTSAHCLRHTFAKLYILNGGDLVRLQKLLGHSTLEMARHYVNLYGNDLKEGYDAMSPLKQFKNSIVHTKK